MYHCVSINKIFSVMDKTFEITFVYEKNSLQHGDSFRCMLEEIILSLSVR